MKGWLFIIAGGLFETSWAYTMKMSEGFTEIPWIVATLVLLAISMILLNEGFRRNVPVGAGYSVWVGIGAVGSAITGVLLFDDPLTIARAVFIAMIIGGVIGLHMTDAGTDSDLSQQDNS